MDRILLTPCEMARKSTRLGINSAVLNKAHIFAVNLFKPTHDHCVMFWSACQLDWLILRNWAIEAYYEVSNTVRIYELLFY